MIIKEFPYPNASGNENVNKLDLTGIDTDQSIVFANCLSEDESIISTDNWFWYKGTKKNVPFTLTSAEINQLKNPVSSENEL